MPNKKKNKKRLKAENKKRKISLPDNKIWLLLFFIPVLAVLSYLMLTTRDTEAPKTERPDPGRPAEQVLPEKIPPAPPPSEPADLPMVAFVIDDIGINMNYFDDLLRIKTPMTLSVLPGRPYTKESIQRAKEEGLEILLHLPMEPDGYPLKNPGKDAIFVFMSDHQIEETVEKGLRSVSGAVGVNNHMGSRITSNAQIMQTIFHVLKRHHLFFIDSRTTAETVACDMALEMGLRADSRSVFLDDEADEDVIAAQVKLLIRKAKEKGYAIGIGHKNKATVKVLGEVLPGIGRMGVRPVFCSELPSLSPLPRSGRLR